MTRPHHEHASVSRRTALTTLLGAALAACGGGGSGDSGTGGGGGGGGGGSSYGGLRVRGTDLVTLDGTPVMLRGMNWGRWGVAQPQDAADNVAQGANCVRIPLRWWGLYDPITNDSRDDGATATACIDPGHLAILDQMMQWAADAGLWIVLFVDSDCGQSGTQDSGEIGYCDPQGRFPDGHNFWTDLDARARFISVWKFVADRYKGNPRLGLFEPLPEPDPTGVDSAGITAFYTEVTAAIRGVAPGVPFLLGARTYDLVNAAAAYNPAWTDVVYTADVWMRDVGTPAQNIQDLGLRLQSLLSIRSQHGVPIFVQQVGVPSGLDPDQAYLNAMLSLLTSRQVGYTWWTYRDAYSPDGYGVNFMGSGNGNGNGHPWITKTAVLAALEHWFAAP